MELRINIEGENVQQIVKDLYTVTSWVMALAALENGSLSAYLKGLAETLQSHIPMEGVSSLAFTGYAFIGTPREHQYKISIDDDAQH